MNFNIDYLMQHISYELHTIIKNWTDTLSSQTKPEVVCAILPTILLSSLRELLTSRFFTHTLLQERNICSLDL